MTLYSPRTLSRPLLPPPSRPLALSLPGLRRRSDLWVPGTDPSRTYTPRPKDIDPDIEKELLYDPPELSQYASRGDLDVDDWPGRVVSHHDIMAASGDPRDWFRYGWRKKAADRAWAEWADARARRELYGNLATNFNWNQILILGDYGSGKTTLGIWLARYFYGLGHAVFSNASCLFGWRLRHEEMYTAMGTMPANSVLLIDESSAALASRVGHSVAVTTFTEMNLNSRKRNCVVIYMSAQDHEIAASIRRYCKEVWMPIPKDELTIEGESRYSGLQPAMNPDNFRMAFHVWDDFPYRRDNLITEDPEERRKGFGPPSYTVYDEGNHVRRAYVLNDTFEMAAAGAATIADKDIIKGNLKDFRDGRVPGTTNGVDNRHHRLNLLLLYLQERRADMPLHFSAGELGQAMGVNPAQAGIIVAEAFAIKQVKGYGFPAHRFYEQLDALELEDLQEVMYQ